MIIMEAATQQYFDAFSKSLQEPAWFTAHRKKALAQLPHAKMPPFRYGLNIIIKPHQFDITKVLPSLHHQNRYLSHANKGVQIYAGNQLNDESLKDFFVDDWNEDHQLYYLHQAYANDFLIIKLPRGTELEDPIEISQDVKDGPLFTTILVLAEENTKANIILQKSSSTGGQILVSDDIRIIAKENSKIEFVTIQDLNSQATNFQKRKAQCAKDSFVHWTDLCIGSSYTKSDVVSLLKEQGAASNIKVLFLGSAEQQFDLFTAAHHEAPQTFSDIVTKGALNQKAKALSRGLINIGETAAGSNGYEKQDVLLLSSQAEADAIPNLEIHNHDVKCSHGSTIGQVDADKIFYAVSRGIPEHVAKQLIVAGYFAPILAKLKNPLIEEKIRETLAKSSS